MLTNEDITLIKSFRKELEYNRTTPVTLNRLSVSGVDPYTKEPINTTITETVNATVKYAISATGSNETNLVFGVTLQEGDLYVGFDIAIDLNDVDSIVYNDTKYKLVGKTPKGLGSFNRYDCLVRKVV